MLILNLRQSNLLLLIAFHVHFGHYPMIPREVASIAWEERWRSATRKPLTFDIRVVNRS